MKWITIDYIKAHSRICSDCENDLLTMYGESAEETVANFLNRGTLEECDASLRTQYGKIPVNILQACLMLVETSYLYRSPDSQSNIYLVPYTFDVLIKPYMILS